MAISIKYKPIISVIMACYNRAEYLKRSINSLILQSFNDWELLFIDDGSSDNSSEILTEFISGSNKINYLKQNHSGLAQSRNNGILASTGEFITFLDSDDAILENHLEVRLNYLRENPSIDLIHGGIKIIGNPYVPDKNNLSNKIHLNECSIGATFFGKRKIFLELQGFKSGIYSEDSEFMERAKIFCNVHKVDFPTYIYHRDTPDSICNNPRNYYKIK